MSSNPIRIKPTMEKTELWEQTLDSLKSTLKPSEFKSWFSRISFEGIENNTVLLSVQNSMIQSKINSDYSVLIKDKINELSGTNLRISVKVNKDLKEKAPKTEVKENKAEDKKNSEVLLNSSYTFDSFVSGENSDFAYNAALAIAKNPGSVYNPCLLYGGVGLGKTHLLQSIGNHIIQNTNLKVMYVTAENFTNEFIQSINTKSQHQFQNKYRKVSVLLMDDIQFLQGKEGSQNELFNTFNDLYETGRQIVFTCDRPIEELKSITERLKSRFQRGLNVDIQPPNYENRVAILRRKCEEKNFTVSQEVLDYIATNISSNVRALESCITKLIAYSTLLNRDINIETAREQLKQIISSNQDLSGITIDSVIRCTAAFYGITAYDIKGRSRTASIVLPRQVAIYLTRKLTDFSTTEIASGFGLKNHTTVMYNVQKVEAMIRSNENDINSVLAKISQQIKSESSAK